MRDYPKILREKIRNGEFNHTTSGHCEDFVQANVVILPKEYAFDFFLFAYRNPKSCPIIDVLEPGEVESNLANGSDIRTDVPKYRVYHDGKVDRELSSIESIWNNDLVTFLIGCSFTFEKTLLDAGISLRHITEGKNVAMYTTTIPTTSAGVFHGPLVVSMPPIKKTLIEKARQITANYPNMHGAPVHIGEPDQIGIEAIDRPDFGDAVKIEDDEEPVFWACGVTPQMAAVKGKVPFMITHSPGHMFVTDVTNDDFLENRTSL